MENKNNKCSLTEHNETEAKVYCQDCKIFMCNKCLNYHSNIFKNHHINNLDKDSKDIFTGFCDVEGHFDKLEFFCKTHNALCCAACLSKIKKKGKGQHTDCDVYIIEKIKDEKKNKLKENIKSLEELSNSLQDLIKKLKNK